MILGWILPVSTVPNDEASVSSTLRMSYSPSARLSTAPEPAPSLSQPSSSFYPFQHGSFFISGTPSAYNPSSYSNPSWPPSPISQIPVSSYSSLNGATAVSPPPGQPSHVRDPPPPMVIEYGTSPRLFYILLTLYSSALPLRP